MLRVDHLKIRNLPAISFAVAGGECVCIQGASGTGKSLLLRAIADLDPSAGQISLDGVDRCDMTGPEWRQKVRYVASESGWWEDMPRSHFPQDAQSNHWLAGLGLDEAHLDRSIARLSTGERQRLALIRAISDNPDILLLDEPTSALDSASSALVEDLIRRQLLEDRAVIMVTHDEDQARRLANRQYALSSDGLREVA